MSEAVRALQRRFARVLFEGDPSHLDDEVRSDARASSEERLLVYANMYVARLVEALGQTYALTRRLLGEDRFDELAARYVYDNPGRHPSLRPYGASLPAFLGAAPEAAPPQAASLAALEWARYDVFDAADEPLLTRESLAALGPEAIAAAPLRRIVASTLVECDHPADESYRAIDAGEAPPAAARRPTTLFVWRQDVQVFHRALTPEEAALLRRLEAPTPLGLLCEARAAEHATVEAAAVEVFAWVGRWIADGVLAVHTDLTLS